MVDDAVLRVVLSIVVGILFAMVFCLRILVLMERRVARIEMHIDRVAQKVFKEELKIEHIFSKKRKKR